MDNQSEMFIWSVCVCVVSEKIQKTYFFMKLRDKRTISIELEVH